MTKFLRIFFLFLITFLSFSIAEAQVWKKQAKSGNTGLLDIAFISKSTGFVLSSGKVLKTTDTGKTWTQILKGYDRFTRIVFADSKHGYIIGYDDLVLKTTDGGTNWSLKRTGNNDDDLETIFLKDSDTIFVSGPDNIDNNDSINYLEYSYNGGNSWNRSNLNNKKAISSINMWNKNEGIITTLYGGIFETKNGFSNYNINTNTSVQITDSKIIQDSIIVLVGTGGKISRSIDYGKTYKSVTSPTSENLKALHFANDTFGMACGEKGTVLYTSNSGSTWTKMTTNTKLDFTKVFVINPYLAWAVAYSTNGDSLDIFKYEDKSCISKYVRVPGDTVICDKYSYETPFVTLGINKPKWTVDDFQTQLFRKNDSTASIVGTHEGYYIIAFELQSCEETLLDTARIYMWRNPKISVKDSLYCGSVNDNISFSCFACKFLWNSTSDAYNFVATQPGKYWVQVTNHCGTISDTFTLSYLPYLKLNLGNDTVLCNQEKLLLKNNLFPGKYVWNDLDTNSSRIISKAGQYHVSFENICNKLSDTLNVIYKKTPGIDLGNDSLYCVAVNHFINLDSVKVNSSIKWDDGNTGYNRNLTSPGKYEVTVSNECGEAKDSIKLYLTNKPVLNLGKDTIYCQNFKHTIGLNPGTSYYTPVWWDNDSSVMREFTVPGMYSVRVYNQCGEASDTIIIIQKSIPKVSLGKDTSLLKPFNLVLDAKNIGSNYLWNTGAKLQTITVTDFGKYWVSVINYCGMATDTIWIKDKAGIKKLTGNSAFKVYPNPVVEGKLVIENLGGEYEVELFDQLGNKVLESSSLVSRQAIDISHLDNGVYYLKIVNNELVVGVVRVLKM